MSYYPYYYGPYLPYYYTYNHLTPVPPSLLQLKMRYAVPDLPLI